MLAVRGCPTTHTKSALPRCPRVPSEHVMVSDVRAEAHHGADLDRDRGGVNQHNYLAHHRGKFWLMWSDAPASRTAWDSG